MNDSGRSPWVTMSLADRAAQVLPGGVTAGGRRNGALGGVLRFTRGHGARLWDLEGREFLDFSSSSGASLLGYDVPEVNEAVSSALSMGTLCTYETAHHVELCELLSEVLPGAERVRLVNTGSEATMAAIRLARHVTGRARVLKFDGHFHGMHELIWFDIPANVEDDYATDAAHIDAPGARVQTAGSSGVPEILGDLLVVVPFNDPAAFRGALDEHGDEFAAVIMEPISYNLGCVPAAPDFLRMVRDETARRGIVLIFDEVLTGFRMSLGGAQEHYGVTADLACWAKALGAGWPIAALTGRSALMDELSPDGPVVVSGTYSGHLASVLAAQAAVGLMAVPGFHDRLNSLSEHFYHGLQALFDAGGLPARVQGVGARFGIYYGSTSPIIDADGARRSWRPAAEAFVRGAVEASLYFHDFAGRRVPMHYGLTAAHTTADIEHALERLGPVVTQLARDVQDARSNAPRPSAL